MNDFKQSGKYNSVLVSRLIELGIDEKNANKHAQLLSQLIVLNTIQHLAKSKNLDLSSINSDDSNAGAAFLNNNFTDKEIADTLVDETEKQLQNYLLEVKKMKK